MSCPIGMNLLSCGYGNTQLQTAEVYVSSRPINSTTCECYNYFGMECRAWCTTGPLDFEIATLKSNGFFNVTCPKHKRVLGCHMSPTVQMNGKFEMWRSFYPLPDGFSCTCYDYYGASCIATCAANVINYQIAAVRAAGNVIATCQATGSIILGHGMQTFVTAPPEAFRTSAVVTNASSSCYDYFNTKCFALCGTLI